MPKTSSVFDLGKESRNVGHDGNRIPAPCLLGRESADLRQRPRRLRNLSLQGSVCHPRSTLGAIKFGPRRSLHAQTPSN